MAGLKPTDVLPGRGPALGTRLFLLLACSILLMVLDSREDYLQYIHSKLNIVVYPIQAAVDLPFALADWVSTSLASRRQLLAENRDLRRQQLRSDASVQKMIAIEAENARLRALMDTAALMTDRTMVTEIMAIDLNPYRRLLTINKGSSAGAYRGQALVDAFGIVGQISDLGPLSSQVLLISDPEHAVPVEVNRNGLRTIAVGTGDAQILNLPFLPNNADIRLGDLLVTSGLGGVFPAGYPVAEVNQIEVNPSQPFAHVEAAPAAELDKVRELLLIWPGDVQDQ
ncbi:MAG: rod shape-determining protein MreC [Proteobacteria bacterium]|nr:rod shape-determining protein MreC [Pseudomonadota bacterium]